MRTLVIICRGIGEPLGTGMLWNVKKFLPEDVFDIIELKWHAEYGPVPGIIGDPFEKNLEDGVSLLLDLCTSVYRNRRIVVLGYSGGAQLAGDALAILARRPGDHNVVGGVLVSDPSQPKGQPGAGRKYGIRGSRPVPSGIPVIWFFDTKDVICCCTPEPDSLMRLIADGSGELSLGGPRAWSGSLARLRLKKFQKHIIPWRMPDKILQQFNTARWEIEGYLFRGDHTEYWKRTNSRTGNQYFVDIARWIRNASEFTPRR
ncbi:lysin B [Gordonia phage Jumbo]|uniref:Lysin B n=1 Tax=Gordonia phage Jumbo TaxID=1887650 RepID=A0A1B3B0N4_9CAUD|nr:lysin B [Gordonia phage Jumbo]AOE44551.1 lysin B [Gordonia phage Jumbo]